MNAAPPSGPIKVVDLFAGCGGFTQGFHSFRPAGAEGSGAVYRSVAAVEHDKAAAATYSANFATSKEARENVHCGDIQDWNASGEALSAEVILGGPPCQGFSGLGLQDANDPRNKLWREYIRAVREIEPAVFVIENVDRFLQSDEFIDLHQEIESGSLKKYQLIAPPGSIAGEPWEKRRRRFLLNAANYGACQARRRAIVIGVHQDWIDPSIPPLALADLWYPRQSHAKKVEHLAEEDSAALFSPTALSESRPARWKTVREIFELSAMVPMSSDLPYRTSRRSDAGDHLPPAYWTYELHLRRNPEPLSLARYRAIPEGGNRKDLRQKRFKMDEMGTISISTDSDYAKFPGEEQELSTPSWDKHNNGTGDVMGRLRLDEPSVTIRTEFFKPEKGRYLHPKEHRPITHYEAALIQGFPLDFKWCGRKLEIARQIGNAVPIPLGRAIAAALHRQLRGPRS